MQAWDSLSGEDHTMLCDQPSPHGPLFIWLEGQLHEHGALAWGALREGLRELEFEDLALKLMSGPGTDATTETPDESGQELRALLNLMLVDRLKLMETEALLASKSDPTALQRYRELQERRLALTPVKTAGSP